MRKGISFETKNICKNFGPTQANKNVNISIKGAEVRGIVGENGSGKSTLVSIIAGILGDYSGEMYINGKKYRPEGPVDANLKGVSIVVQELGLVQGLTVAENLFLGKTAPFTNKGIINKKELYKAASDQLKRWGIDNISANSVAGMLSVEDKKMVELSRALLGDPDIIIFDEITAALSEDRRRFFYNLVEDLKKLGKIVIFISHDLQEVLNISDNITVMKDGEVVTTKASTALDEDSLKKLMVGREVKDIYYRSKIKTTPCAGKVAMEVKGLSYDGIFTDISFTLFYGEILGIAGLSGCGMHDLGKTIFGLIPGFEGEIYLPSKKARVKDIKSAITAGISYVPKDRDDEGLMLRASVKDNICLPSIDNLIKKIGFISPGEKKKLAKDIVNNFQIKTRDIEQNIYELSGGNKQKVSISSWMAKNNEILILDCPTRGVDIGVKAYIYQRIVEAREDGVAILLISDELPELIGISDRIIVMKNGRIEGIFNREDGFSEDEIIEVMI